VEQYFDFAYGLADQFYVLKRGTVALQGRKGELSKDSLRQTVSV
jgi:urea transport system ATP-binding protein